MQMDQINTLTVQNSLVPVLYRLLNVAFGLTEIHGQEDWYDSFSLDGATKPSKQAIEDEFLIYKQELVDEENARLAEEARKEDLRTRFEAIPRGLFDQLHPTKGNKDAWLVEEVLPSSDPDAEALIAALEAEKAEYDAKMSDLSDMEALHAIGKNNERACNKAYNIINGHGFSLTTEQIVQLKTQHSVAFDLIKYQEPRALKQYVESLTPDGTLITVTLKSAILAGLEQFGI